MKRTTNLLFASGLTLATLIGCGEDADPTASEAPTASPTAEVTATEGSTATQTPAPTVTETGTPSDDPDGDGFGSDTDCDPNNADINPDAIEVCDEVDNDCDTLTDEAVTLSFYPDADNDGYGDADAALEDMVEACEAPAGYSATGDDCDDATRLVYPERVDACDGIDNDCDEAVDEDPDLMVYTDVDGDGYGAGEGVAGCEAGDGLSFYNTDCADNDAAFNPEAQEVWANDTDEDCDGEANTANVYVVKSSADLPDLDATSFSKIQDGINAVSSGLTIAVGPGTYSENINFLGKDLTIVSMNGPETTIIDGTGGASTVLLVNGEGTNGTAMLKGFTITGGSGVDSTVCGNVLGFTYGGGICTRNASATLIGNIIEGNSVTGSGGGLYIDEGTVDMHDNIVRNNTASYDAGGLNLSRVTGEVGNNLFSNNISKRFAGAIYAFEGSPHIFNNVFVENEADGTVLPPTPAQGGAIYSQLSNPLVENNVFAYNFSDSSGGGVAILNEDTGSGAGGTYINNTFIANEAVVAGGGFQVGAGNPVLMSNILAFNSAPTGANAEVAAAGSADSSYNVFWLASGAMGMAGFDFGETDLNSDPGLVDDSTDVNGSDDDYRLTSVSPAIDAGPMGDEYFDVDGSRNDIGAYGGPLGNDFSFDVQEGLSD